MNINIKTIAHLIATNFYGGPEKQIIEHLILLNNRRYKSIIGSYLEKNDRNEIINQANQRDIVNFEIPMASPFDFRALRLLENELRQHAVDLLCTHHYKSTIMGWWVGKKLGIPVIAFSRGYTAENLKIRFYELLERQVLGKVDGVIAVSHGQLRKLRSLGICSRREWVVHNAVSVDQKISSYHAENRSKILQLFGLPQESLMIVTAGRLSPEKGHRYLVEAIANLGTMIKNANFVFCGEGVCKEDLIAQARRLGIARHCFFVGFRRDIDKIFHAMDLFVLPSLTEGLPNVILEAFAFAKPVVATQVGGVAELVDDGVNGFLVPPKRPDLLAKAIAQCLSETSILEPMGNAGLEKVSRQFTFQKQTRQLEKIYGSILSAKDK